MFLSGKLIHFEPIEVKKIDVFWEHVNNPFVTQFMFTGQVPITKEQLRGIFKDDIKNGAHLFFVYENESGNLIGYTGLWEFDWIGRSAEMRLFIMPDFWGNSYGTEAYKIDVFYGFDRLNLHRVYCGATDANIGSIKAIERAGCIKEGVLRSAFYRNSCYYNLVRFGILREEYYEKYHKKYLADFGGTP